MKLTTFLSSLRSFIEPSFCFTLLDHITWQTDRIALVWSALRRSRAEALKYTKILFRNFLIAYLKPIANAEIRVPLLWNIPFLKVFPKEVAVPKLVLYYPKSLLHKERMPKHTDNFTDYLRNNLGENRTEKAQGSKKKYLSKKFVTKINSTVIITILKIRNALKI